MSCAMASSSGPWTSQEEDVAAEHDRANSVYTANHTGAANASYRTDWRGQAIHPGRSGHEQAIKVSSYTAGVCRSPGADGCSPIVVHGEDTFCDDPGEACGLEDGPSISLTAALT
ncbi:hypothetical protein DOTSEDRAFT_33271 [Dothistroma septosporum NZE10]|uniref:Uncharacterized protein n=1 Tax=Dothistroma septosporum (strain NZE10 / CBS 128990) TaxID=675120 RepID=N1PWW8_DOTSN|nr:hypothetical protein DOTSEDRAFT_33271 [Dothistroma septosporum NZE10]